MLDLNQDRLLTGSIISKRLGVHNVKFEYGSIEKVPYPDGYFDAIFCYSVIMFTNETQSLREFARVLRPNGRLYVMTDLWRWQVRNLCELGPLDRCKTLGKALVNWMLRRGTKLYTIKSFERRVTECGFQIHSRGQDGFASFGAMQDIDAGKFAFYPTLQSGREELWEVCAYRVL